MHTFICQCGHMFQIRGRIGWNGCKGLSHTGKRLDRNQQNKISCPKCSRTQGEKNKT